MNIVDTLKPRDAVAEHLRQALELLSAMPFQQIANYTEFGKLKEAHTVITRALRALDEDPECPSRQSVEIDRHAVTPDEIGRALDARLAWAWGGQIRDAKDQPPLMNIAVDPPLPWPLHRRDRHADTVTNGLRCQECKASFLVDDDGDYAAVIAAFREHSCRQ